MAKMPLDDFLFPSLAQLVHNVDYNKSPIFSWLLLYRRVFLDAKVLIYLGYNALSGAGTVSELLYYISSK
jgi:hypothetical protein